MLFQHREVLRKVVSMQQVYSLKELRTIFEKKHQSDLRAYVLLNVSGI